MLWHHSNEIDRYLYFPATAISARRRRFLHIWAFLAHDRLSLAFHDLGISCPLEPDIRIRWNSKSEITRPQLIKAKSFPCSEDANMATPNDLNSEMRKRGKGDFSLYDIKLTHIMEDNISTIVLDSDLLLEECREGFRVPVVFLWLQVG